MKVCRPVIFKLLTVVRADQPALLPSAEGRRVDALGALCGTTPSGRPPRPLRAASPAPPASLSRRGSRTVSADPDGGPLVVSPPSLVHLGACTLDLHRRLFRCEATPSAECRALRGWAGTGPDRNISKARASSRFFFPPPLPFVSLAAGGGARVPSALDGAARAVDVGRPNRVFLDGRRAGWVAPVSLSARHDGNCCGAAPFVGAGMGALWDGRDARCGPRRRHI